MSCIDSEPSFAGSRAIVGDRAWSGASFFEDTGRRCETGYTGDGLYRVAGGSDGGQGVPATVFRYTGPLEPGSHRIEHPHTYGGHVTIAFSVGMATAQPDAGAAGADGFAEAAPETDAASTPDRATTVDAGPGPDAATLAPRSASNGGCSVVPETPIAPPVGFSCWLLLAATGSIAAWRCGQKSRRDRPQPGAQPRLE